MDAELSALAKNGTWKLVDIPPHVKPIGCKWVYKINIELMGPLSVTGNVSLTKVIIKLKGLFITFSPLTKLTTVRLILALASIQGWFLHQLDVNKAFLYGDLSEDVYMVVPPGVTTTCKS